MESASQDKIPQRTVKDRPHLQLACITKSLPLLANTNKIMLTTRLLLSVNLKLAILSTERVTVQIKVMTTLVRSSKYQVSGTWQNIISAVTLMTARMDIHAEPVKVRLWLEAAVMTAQHPPHVSKNTQLVKVVITIGGNSVSDTNLEAVQLIRKKYCVYLVDLLPKGQRKKLSITS